MFGHNWRGVQEFVVSQAQALENRRRAVAAASRLFRERGVNGVSVADLMKSIGLTTGGFYKQFSSKEALIAEAAQAAFRGS
ncbi:TetR/AcrR family transcriptional regulator [Streptomyces coeruleorubidus]